MYLLITYVPGSVLGTEDTAQNRADQISALLGGTDSEQVNKQMCNVRQRKGLKTKQNETTTKNPPQTTPRDL